MIGIDIVEIDGLRKRGKKYGKLFLDKIFTEQELLADGYDPNRLNYKRLAAFFAAKEAVMKALGNGNVRWRDIEIKSNASMRPRVTLYGSTRKLSDRLGIEDIQLSLSYSRKHAIAFAIATRRRA